MMIDPVMREEQIIQQRGEMMISVIVPCGQVSLPADTFAMVDEWARWARPRLSLEKHGRCASAEGRYDAVYPDAARGVSIQTDLPAVLAVERVVCTKLPVFSREVVLRHFVRRELPTAIARVLGIHRARYGAELRRAVLMIKNNLTRA